MHQEFVYEMIQVTERLFSSPDLEAELSVAVRKKRHETQLAVFNKLQSIAVEKLEELDIFWTSRSMSGIRCLHKG